MSCKQQSFDIFLILVNPTIIEVSLSWNNGLWKNQSLKLVVLVFMLPKTCLQSHKPWSTIKLIGNLKLNTFRLVVYLVVDERMIYLDFF